MASEPLTWLLFSYRLPRNPSRLRLAAWRRLRRIGAVLLHETIWALPADPKIREHLEWLAEEIEENGGTAHLWRAESLSNNQEQEIVARFRVEAEARFKEIVESANAIARAVLSPRRRLAPSRLRHALRQLKGLQRAVRLERHRDHFRVEARLGTGAAVRAAVVAIEESLSSSSQSLTRRANAVDN